MSNVCVVAAENTQRTNLSHALPGSFSAAVDRKRKKQYHHANGHSRDPHPQEKFCVCTWPRRAAVVEL